MQAHYRSLYGYGSKFSKDTEFVKDCIQDLFLELWKNRATLGETCHPRFYLLKSLRRKMYRTLHKNRWYAQAEPVSDTYQFDAAFSVEHLLIREQTLRDTAAKITAVLNQLPRRQKEIIHLRFFEELEADQIVQIMEISHQSVYNLLHRAISNLRQFWPSETEQLSLFVLITLSLPG